MPSALASQRRPAQHDDLDNYDVDDFDDDDNPFASPPPESSNKKRKEPDTGLGIDEEVSVQKRARVPNVKLDEERLLGPAGIPKLRKRAAGLRLKGKGHEFSDASRLLSFYQLWLDDLFPKARFLDALGMVEKAGHKKKLMTARTEWINEGRPKTTAGDDEEEETAETGQANTDDAAVESSSSSTQHSSAMERPRTPPPPGGSDVPDDDDLYDATPRVQRATNRPPPGDDAPDEDDLAALMAEAEGVDNQQSTTITTTRSSTKRLSNPEPDGDDLDALIAEAEEKDQQNSRPQQANKGANGGDFADDEAAMQEMEGLW